MKAQLALPSFAPVYAALTAVINTKLPENGETVLKRVVVQFRRSYKRNDKPVCTAMVRFIAHLINQQVAHEILGLQILAVLLEKPTDDSVELAVSFVKEAGAAMLQLSPQGLHAIMERFRGVLHEGTIDKCACRGPRPPAAMHSALYLRVESGAYAPHADDCAIRPYPTGRAPRGGVKTLGTMGNCGNPTDGGRGHTLSAPASPLRINASIRFLFPAAALCERQPPAARPGPPPRRGGPSPGEAARGRRPSGPLPWAARLCVRLRGDCLWGRRAARGVCSRSKVVAVGAERAPVYVHAEGRGARAGGTFTRKCSTVRHKFIPIERQWYRRLVTIR